MRTILVASFTALVLAAAAVAGDGDVASPTQPAGPPAWVYPRNVECAGRRLGIGEPIAISYDAAAARAELRFPVTVTDPLGRVTYGAIEAGGTTRLDLASRLFRVDAVEIAKSTFPGLAPADLKPLQDGLADAVPKSFLLRLEVLTARPGAAPPAGEPPKFSNQPPAIFVRNRPAVLVQVDGEPVLFGVEDFPLQYLGNSASDVFRDPKTDTWYLLVDGTWAQAKALAGPWQPLKGPLPTTLTQIPEKNPRGHVRRFVPGTTEYKKPDAAAAKELPEIIVSDKPAELVLLQGDPLFTWVPGVKLMLVANTESDLFFHPKSGLYYLLVSGRWFTADDIDGTWKENYGPLPEEFARIPRDHVRGHVVWCVPGTPEASEACVQAGLEERVSISRANTVQVLWEGKELSFAPVEGDLKMATNTDDDVFLVGDVCYVCQRGLWYSSADRQSWKPCTEIPAALRSVPPGSCAYEVNSCRPAGADGDAVMFALTSGYYGVFPWKGSPVHGTGWTRRGIARGNNWYPYPRTYGENRWYDPATGVFLPRTACYRADGTAAADEWSPYTASYGREGIYGSRYDQGGRRMYPLTPDESGFDTAVARPDVYALWFDYVKRREGLAPKEFPLGDRRDETAPAEPRIAVDDAGKAWRLGAAGPEGFEGGKWTAGTPAPEVRAWLDAEARIDARPAQWKTWRTLRAAPLPVNPVATPRAAK